VQVTGAERRRRVSPKVDHALRVRRTFQYVKRYFVGNHIFSLVIPAQAVIQDCSRAGFDSWIPACAGMTT
jgi:hypothetical protein